MATNNNIEPTNIDWDRALCAGICLQATIDYVEKPDQRESIADFFASDWGRALCKNMGMDADKMLDKLESGEIAQKIRRARNGRIVVSDQDVRDELLADLMLEQQERM